MLKDIYRILKISIDIFTINHSGIFRRSFNSFRQTPNAKLQQVEGHEKVLQVLPLSGSGLGLGFTLWSFNIAMGNGPFIEVYLLTFGIFHSYVSHNQRVVDLGPQGGFLSHGTTNLAG